ncbi:8982_t:CDS:2 [Funneliformis mosseae]|uniref:8982_t:CDS:1 n=1 Tax=Funneliformis mosseae TaxID=27381 RepID=A0A9N8V121_FUNMO|nr:8982_t:CDS:2 [Funneliformis mosseae]
MAEASLITTGLHQQGLNFASAENLLMLYLANSESYFQNYNPLNPDCVSYKFISPKADDKIKVTDEIEVVWKRDSSKIIEVQGLDLYDENGNFIDSLTSHKSIFGADDKASIKVKLTIPLDTSQTGKFLFKTVASTGEGPTCPEFMYYADD